MREFDFAEPSSVAEASQMLADQGDDARIIAGGSALMLAMRQRMLAPTHLISVARLPRLHGIDFDPREGLRIGAMSRHIDVARSELVKAHAPVLARMAAQVANPADWARPRTLDPADAQRRAVVLDKYRKGELTSSEKDDNATGAVSSVVK